ncbi:MAG: hypothetical protein V2A79_12875 [Planctomycetota bacterium]
MPDKSIHDTSPRRLADLLQMSEGDDVIWRPEELGGILRHQLSVPIEFDLGALRRGAARKLRTGADAQGLLLRSFGDLFRHPNPPIGLLKMTKQFAKANRNQPDSPLPREISTILYYASIAAALVRCRKRIAELDDAALREGFAWGCQQPWIDDATRALFEEGLKLLPG